MNQRELKALLEEAANLGCSMQRRNEIRFILCDSTAAVGKDGIEEIDGPEAGLRLLAETLYHDTISNRPELLTKLFPVFAIICGNREDGMTITDIDWSIVD